MSWPVYHYVDDPTLKSEIPKAVDDQKLIERCRAGEREAQRELYELTCGRVYGLLLKMTGNTDDAFDLTQETYVKGLQRLDQFDGRSAISSWFYRIAINEALQFRRRNSTHNLKLKELAQIKPKEAITPTADLKLDVEDALAALSPDDQSLLLLKYQESLDYQNLAEILDCAPGTVASRLNRARVRLRELLRKSYE